MTAEGQAESIADALEGKQTRSGWVAKCPAHDDRTPSLDLTVRDNKLLLVCRAGCGQDQVIDALKDKGLWDTSTPAPKYLVATFEYRDQDGNLLAYKDRFEPPQGKKLLAWRDKHGKQGLNGDKPLLFGTELLKGTPRDDLILVVEGEKTALAGRDAGYVTLCAPNGSQAWNDAHARLLRGRHVALLPDNDAPGRKHMHSAFDVMKPYVRSVRGVVLPDQQEKDDLVDWMKEREPADLKAVLDAQKPQYVNANPIYPYHLLHDVMPRIYDGIVTANENGGKLAGISTGFPLLDHITSGFKKQQLIILGGRLGSGKTAMALTILHHIAKSGIPVGFFSMEMDIESVAKRLLALDAGVDFGHIENGMLMEHEWDAVTTAIPRTQTMPLYIDDTGDLSLDLLDERMDEMIACHGVRVVALDYLQIMAGPRGHSKVQEVATLSRGLKKLARKHDVPVMALAQLNRNAASETDRDGKVRPKKPTLENLADSDQIGRDADVVLLVSRPGEDEGPVEEEKIAKLWIAKQRNGATGKVSLYFDAPRMRFMDLKTAV